MFGQEQEWHLRDVIPTSIRFYRATFAGWRKAASVTGKADFSMKGVGSTHALLTRERLKAAETHHAIRECLRSDG